MFHKYLMIICCYCRCLKQSSHQVLLIKNSFVCCTIFENIYHNWTNFLLRFFDILKVAPHVLTQFAMNFRLSVHLTFFAPPYIINNINETSQQKRNARVLLRALYQITILIISIKYLYQDTHVHWITFLYHSYKAKNKYYESISLTYFIALSVTSPSFIPFTHAAVRVKEIFPTLYILIIIISYILCELHLLYIAKEGKNYIIWENTTALMYVLNKCFLSSCWCALLQIFAKSTK